MTHFPTVRRSRLTALGSALIMASAGLVLNPSGTAAAAPVGEPAEPREYWGWVLAAGDFNGDGLRDLATGAPSDRGGVGTVTVLYGSKRGLSLTGSEVWTQNSLTPHSAEPGDGFGSALAPGDFNADGFTDLAVGAPGEDVGSPSVLYAGVVHIIFGSRSGLRALGNEVWSQNRPGVSDAAETRDNFGSALAAADLGRSGAADLAIGVPDENLPVNSDCVCRAVGLVHVLYGTRQGLDGRRSQTWSQDRRGVRGTAEQYDDFGAALATGRLGKGRHADLVVGAPYESEGFGAPRDSRAPGAGAVHVFYGSPGLRADGNDYITQDSRRVPGISERGDHFGEALAVGTMDRGRVADLAIGASAENLPEHGNAGAVTVLRGLTRGIPLEAQVLTEDTIGIDGRSGDEHRFGAALAARDLGRSVQADLAIGQPGSCFGGSADRGGAVVVVYGSAGGPRPQRSQRWTEDSGGVPGASAPNDCFGRALTAAQFGAGTKSDLAVGAPGESLGPLGAVTVEDAGAVYALYGTIGGLSGSRSQRWTQTPPEPAVPTGLPVGETRRVAASASGDFDDDMFTDSRVRPEAAQGLG